MSFTSNVFKELNNLKTGGVTGGNEYTKKVLNNVSTSPLKKKKEDEVIEIFRADRVWEDDDIAPVKNDGFFKKSKVFDDGYDIGDVTKAILGTGGDIALGVGKGLANLAEGAADIISYGVADVADAFGADEYAQGVRKKAKREFYNSLLQGADDYLDQYSVLGNTSDAVFQGIGQVAGIIATGGALAGAGVGAAGVTAATTGLTGLSAAGTARSEAYRSGATDKESAIHGLIAGSGEAATNLLFGGLGKGVKALGLSHGLSSADDILAKTVANKFNSQIAKNFVEYGIKSGAEGVEEVLSGVVDAVSKKVTYMSEEDILDILQDENLLEQFIVGSVTSGFMQSGVIPGTKSGSLIESTKDGRDFITGLDQNEQTVVDALYKERLAETEESDSKKKKSKIYDELLRDLEKGYISTDKIEELLGGDTYKTYRETADAEDAIFKEYEELGNLQNATLAQQERYRELIQQIQGIKTTSKRNELKTQLSEEVMGLVNGSRLAESFNERARRSQTFEADLSQYDAPQQQVIQKAIDSGVLNNTNRTHEFVDMVAKISADKGVLFDFANNQKIKDSGFAVEGETVNGYITKDGITLNIDSPKLLDSTVGHEITHVLEGTELYTELQNVLFEYAKSKNDYQGRYDALTRIYANVQGANIEAELTADLVGDYLFTDSDFIGKLSTANRNVFQKVYDEIKYLCKVATAGSKEARELEKVKRAFDKAYRESGGYATIRNVMKEGDAGAKYSLSDSDGGTPINEITENGLTMTYVRVPGQNTQYYGSTYGQNIEPAGEYMSMDTMQGSNKIDGYEYGTIQFKKPLVLEHINTSDTGWKKTVSDMYNGLTGKKLTRALIKDGYDAIVTYDDYGYSEIVNLNGTKLNQDSGTRFSLSEEVEKTDRFVAVHNKSARGVMRMLERDGVPFASIAVKRAGTSHEGFGECSIVFPRSTIDPQESKWNKLYSNDAWTQTEPRPEYDVGDTYKIKTLFENMLGSDIYHALKGSSFLSSDFLERELASEGGNVFDAVKRIGAVKYGYLQSIGQRPEAGTKPKRLDGFGRYKNDQLLAVFEAVDGETLRNANYDSAEVLQQIADALNEQFLTQLPARDSVFKSFRKKPLYTADNINLAAVKDAYEEWESAGRTIPTEMDIYSLENTLRDNRALEEDAGYQRWVEGVFDGLIKDSGIRNGKEIFTPSGNRRSFKQTHVPATLDNIVQIMRKENETGVGTLGSINLRGAATKTYGSVEDMRQDIDKLLGTHVEDEVYQSYMQGFYNRLSELVSKTAKGDDWSSRGTAEEILLEAVRDAKNKAAMNTKLRKEAQWINYDSSLVEDLWQLKQDVQNMPAPYFEAKPRRVVTPDEAAAYIIPDNAPAQLFAELDKRGLVYKTYKAGDEADRLAKLNSVLDEQPDLRFSLSAEGETPRTYGRYNVPATELRLETEQDVVPIPKIGEENLFPDDLDADIDAQIDRVAEEKATLDAESGQLYIDYADQKVSQEEFEARMTEINEKWMAADRELNRLEGIKAEDGQRFEAIDDSDAPPEAEAPYVEPPEVITLTKKAVTDIAREVRQTLSLTNRQMSELRGVIEDYSEAKYPDREKLFQYIQDRFGHINESELNEELAEVQSVLRSYKLNVSDSIKSDIADYAPMMRSNFGKVRFSKEGSAVDAAYEELSSMFPGYFPDDITNPTDQFLRIVDVANFDRITERNYDVDDATLNEAVDAIVNGINDFKQTQKQRQAERFDRDSFADLVRHGDEYAPPAEEDIAPAKQTDKQQESETENGKTVRRKELHQNIVNNIKARFSDSGFDFDAALKNAKDLSTFATVDNTPQRVMEKALGYKEGQILSDITVDQVARNESEGAKWLNSYTDRKNGILAQISKQYGIKPGSKESAAAQMYAEGFYVDENNDIIEYGDAELAVDFPDAKVRHNIKRLAGDKRIRQIYDETLAAINESRTRNAYPEIPRLDNYFLHFRAMDDTFSRLGLPFNPNDIRAKDLPTDLNGVTADLKPGQPYFASALHRRGKRTSFDLLGGLERYLTSAKNQIYHIDDIQTLRAVRNYIADQYGQANGLENLDMLTDEEAQERIEQVFGSHLSTFAKFLNEEANVIAGKTALIDRGLEGIIGRRGITFLNTINRQVGSNMVGFNVSSSLTNFLPVVQTIAKTNKADFLKAFTQTASHKLGSVFGKTDSFVENNPTIIRRKGADRFYRTPFQKVADFGYTLMSAVDDVSTELIVRTKYNELIRKGNDEQTAIREADKWVSRLMGDRSLGQQPHLYNSKMLGLITKFQLEVRNQLDSQFYDTIQEAKVSTEYIENGLARNAKTAAKVGSTFVQLAVLQHLFGKAFESVAGYNPAFDIIEVLATAFGFDDDEESEDTVLDNIEQGFLALLEDLPYASTFTGGGRIPISSALPVKELVQGEDKYGNEKSRWKTLGEVAPYYVLPAGYGQIKKSAQGLQMFSDDHPIAGSYTDSGNLRFPVEDTLGNRVKAGIFGQYSSENARKYFDEEQRTLNPEQTEILAGLDIPVEEYWEYRDNLYEFYDVKDQLKEAADADGATDEDILKSKYANAIYGDIYDLYDEQKEIASGNASGGQTELRILQNKMEDMLAEINTALDNVYVDGIYAEVGGKRFDKSDNGSWYEISSDYDPYGFYEREQKAVNGFGISYAEYWNNREVYDEAYSAATSYDKNLLETAKNVFGVDSWADYAYGMKDINGKDENGKSVNGLKKERILDYVNSLDADYGEKIVLFKSQYPKDDTYNYDIIEYLNSRDDISYDEMETILKELGFEVDSRGYITWD